MTLFLVFLLRQYYDAWFFTIAILVMIKKQLGTICNLLIYLSPIVPSRFISSF